MTIKTPDINAISGGITDDLLTEYDDIKAVTQKEASISSISDTYQFISSQLNIAKQNFYLLQDSLAIFNDKNRNIKSDSLTVSSNVCVDLDGFLS